MKITIRIHHDKVLEELYLPVYLLIKEFKGQWEAIGAMMALVTGFLCPVIGAILSLIISFTRMSYGKSILNKVSVILFVMTIPLLMLGSHFLDLLDQKKQARQVNETHIEAGNKIFEI